MYTHVYGDDAAATQYSSVCLCSHTLTHLFVFRSRCKFAPFSSLHLLWPQLQCPSMLHNIKRKFKLFLNTIRCRNFRCARISVVCRCRFTDLCVNLSRTFVFFSRFFSAVAIRLVSAVVPSAWIKSKRTGVCCSRSCCRSCSFSWCCRCWAGRRFPLTTLHQVCALFV